MVCWTGGEKDGTKKVRGVKDKRISLLLLVWMPLFSLPLTPPPPEGEAPPPPTQQPALEE